MKEDVGSDVLSFMEAVRLSKGVEMPDLSEDELILLVLGVVDKPVQGKVVIQKEVFIFYQELKDKLKIIDPQFVPFRYGPFSFRIATLLDLLEYLEFIVVTNRGRRRLARYSLSEKGRKYAEEVIEKIRRKLGDEYIEKLRRLRQGLDELGHDGILRYVYQYYPQYTDKSELKDKYAHIDWGVTEA